MRVRPGRTCPEPGAGRRPPPSRPDRRLARPVSPLTPAGLRRPAPFAERISRTRPRPVRSARFQEIPAGQTA